MSSYGEDCTYDANGWRGELCIGPNERKFFFSDQERNGGVTQDQFHGLVLVVPLSHFVERRAIGTRLRSDWQPLLERVYDGHGTRYDGHNLVGFLSGDARDALDEIESHIRDEYDNEDVAAGLATDEEEEDA